MSTLFDFKKSNEIERWLVVNDGVMGGVSESQIKWNEKNETLIFSGNVSLENYGGFASIRTYPQKFEVKKFSKIKLRVKGDGKNYKFRLRASNQFDGIAYSQNFTTKKDAWTELTLNMSDFKATFRGRIFSDYPEFQPKDLQQIGILIADKQVGQFNLEIDWIKTL